MKAHARLLGAALLASAALAYGCSDGNGPMEPARDGALSLAPLSAVQAVVPVSRTTELAAPLTASRVIGPGGGVLELPDAGLRVSFAAGAVQTPVRITVTAPAGGAVAYDFQPHGLTFAAPVTVSQSLAGTAVSEAVLGDLRGAYFEGSFGDGSAKIVELLPASVNATASAASFVVEHFSGYALAQPRGSDSN